MEDAYCYNHPEKVGYSKCFSCQKPLCEKCAHFKYGYTYCDVCFTTHESKTLRHDDKMKYEERKVKTTDYVAILVKYGIRFCIIVLIISAVINRQKLLAYAQENLPIKNLDFLSKFTAQKNSNGSTKSPADTILGPINKVKNDILQSILVIQMQKFAAQVDLFYEMNQRYPSDFDSFLRTEFDSKSKDKDIAKDQWGNSFRLDIADNGFSIISAGPDGSFDTEDDIKYEHKR